MLGKLIFTGIAAWIGSEIGKTKGETEAERKQNGARGAMLGASLSLIGSELFNEKADTVNYTLYNKGERVYDGITYEERLSRRVSEHRSSGKIFDRVKTDKAKPRTTALEKERKKIKKHKGSYNIHHNS